MTGRLVRPGGLSPAMPPLLGLARRHEHTLLQTGRSPGAEELCRNGGTEENCLNAKLESRD